MQHGQIRAIGTTLSAQGLRAAHVYFCGPQTRTRIPPSGTRVVTILNLKEAKSCLPAEVRGILLREVSPLFRQVVQRKDG